MGARIRIARNAPALDRNTTTTPKTLGENARIVPGAGSGCFHAKHAEGEERSKNQNTAIDNIEQKP